MDTTTETTSNEVAEPNTVSEQKSPFFRRPPNPFKRVDTSKSLRGNRAPGRKTRGMEVVNLEIDGEKIRALLAPKRGLRRHEIDPDRELTEYDQMMLERAVAKRNRKARRNLELLGE